MKILPDWLKNGYLRLMDPIADWLVRRDVHPNTITIVGTVFMVAGGVLYGTGHIMTGGWLLSITAFTDVLDGTVARRSNKSSVFGAFLDSSLDRVADGAVLGGLAVFYALNPIHRSVPMVVVCLASIIGAFMTSYTRARAEALGLDAKVGMLQRPERVVLLSAPQALFGLTLNGWVLAIIINILTITAWITVVQRIKYVYDRTRTRGPAAEPAREIEPTEYRLWSRRPRRDTSARPMLKGE
jgi:CDP-diacylglycerol---glycerol-3-phosphate 3-phosphatidyltransferase